MNIIEVTVGKKIDYKVSGTKITFNDELTVDCEKLERDQEVVRDICIAKDGSLTIGQLGEKYAAQIEIPPRVYIEKKAPNPDYIPTETEADIEEIKEEAKGINDVQKQEYFIENIPVAFSMKNVTLKLYMVE